MVDTELREFNTWEDPDEPGVLYHAVGTIQMFSRGYTPWQQRFVEPPVLEVNLRAWMQQRGVSLVDFALGPPHFKFPSAAAAEEFRLRWHGPGEAQRIGREHQIQCAEPLDFDNLPSVEEQEARHALNWQVGLRARAEYCAQHGISE